MMGGLKVIGKNKKIMDKIISKRLKVTGTELAGSSYRGLLAGGGGEHRYYLH